MKRLSTTALLALLGACSGSISDGKGSNDSTPPTIEIESPARGTIADGTGITVTGRVHDTESSIAEVRINDQVATLSGGSFTIDLTGTDGINILRTRATDAAGNVGSDNRAVLIGALADQGTTIADGIVSKIDGTAMAGLGALVSELAGNTDWTALATSLNPIVDSGDGCNSARVNVHSVTTSGVPVTALPAVGGFQTGVTVRDLVVTGEVKYRAVCIGGSADFEVRATTYDLGGLVRPTLADGDITIALDGVLSDFTGFNINVSGVPGFVENLFEDDVRDRLADMLRDQVQQMVPALASAFLADFLADSYSISVLDQTLDVTLAPTEMTWDETGGRIALDTSATIADLEGAMFLSTPTAAPTEMGAGLTVGLADDVANQLLALFWASGAMDYDYMPDEGSPVRAFFPDADSIVLSLSLPPVVDADTTTGALKLTFGDLMVEARDLDQGLGTVARFAVSASLDLSATLTADGRMMLQTGTPQIVSQLIEQAPDLPIVLDEAKVTAIAELGINQLADTIDTLLGTLPIPGIPGAELSSPTFEPRGGYVLLGGSIAVPTP